MEFDIYALLKQGVPMEEIETLIAESIERTKAQYETEKACAQARVKDEEAAVAAKEEEAQRSALMAEGRAYFINAILAYTEALEGKTLTEEEVAQLEKVAIEMEAMLIQTMQLKSKLEEMDEVDLDNLLDMFGM